VEKSQDRVLQETISRSYPDTLLLSQGISGSGVKKKSTSDQIRAAKECLLKHVLAFFLRATGRSCIARLLFSLCSFNMVFRRVSRWSQRGMMLTCAVHRLCDPRYLVHSSLALTSVLGLTVMQVHLHTASEACLILAIAYGPKPRGGGLCCLRQPIATVQVFSSQSHQRPH
jgi:hypothetical protein